MPRVIITAGAVRGMVRCRAALAEKSPQAAKRAAKAIADKIVLLESYPHAGRPLDDEPELRELLIPFGDAGYVALYRHHPAEGAVYVLAFRHQKDAGY